MKPANTPIRNLGDVLELTIDSLSYSGGRGVGRFEGVVVFVPDTAPGDVIRARVTALKPRFLEAEVVELLRRSPHRRKALCPVFGRCGGCTWQHVTYEQQLFQKEQILRNSLKKLSQMAAIEWRPFVPAQEEFYYRNRVQLQVRGGQAGFFARHSRELVAIETCAIADDRINRQLPALRERAFDGRVEVAVRADGETSVFITERDPEAVLFGQVNTNQNERLKGMVAAAIEGEPEWIFDLYAGSGNLTAPILKRFPQAEVTAVELSRAAVQQGEKLLKLDNLRWFAGDVGAALKRMSVQSDRPGAIVLDPPRSGCADQVLREVIRHAPKQIVYVSCNPTTFARDMEKLIRARPGQTLSVQGLDMFPQTEHVELVASLRGAT